MIPANLGKTARANAQTLKAIRFLEEQDALSTLPEVLQQGRQTDAVPGPFAHGTVRLL